MPYTAPPSKIKGMPEHAQKIWTKAFNAAYASTPKGQDKDEYAHKVAYSAVSKAGYKKNKEGIWEAVSSSSQGALMRACPKCGKKECECEVKTVEANKIFTISSLREATINEVKREVQVIILAEGKGNKRDKHYYTKEAITGASAVFEGAQCYTDHPSKSEEYDRPERSIRELIGHFKDVHAEIREGKTVLVGNLKIVEGSSYDWAWDLAKESVKYAQQYPEKDLVGISINADGQTKEGEIDGETWNMVSKITEVFSADIVTRPAAGGRFIKMMEQEQAMRKKSIVKGEVKKMGEEFKKALDGVKAMCGEARKKMGEEEADGDYAKGLDGLSAKIDELLGLEKAEAGEEEVKPEEKPEEKPVEKKEEEAKEEEVEDEAEEEAKKKATESEKVKTLEERVALLEAREALIKESALMDKLLESSKLPRKATQFLRPILKGLDEKSMAKKVDEFRESLKDVLESKPEGVAQKAGIQVVVHPYEKIVKKSVGE